MTPVERLIKYGEIFVDDVQTHMRVFATEHVTALEHCALLDRSTPEAANYANLRHITGIGGFNWHDRYVNLCSCRRWPSVAAHYAEVYGDEPEQLFWPAWRASLSRLRPSMLYPVDRFLQRSGLQLTDVPQELLYAPTHVRIGDETDVLKLPNGQELYDEMLRPINIDALRPSRRLANRLELELNFILGDVIDSTQAVMQPDFDALTAAERRELYEFYDYRKFGPDAGCGCGDPTDTGEPQLYGSFDEFDLTMWCETLMSIHWKQLADAYGAYWATAYGYEPSDY